MAYYVRIAFAVTVCLIVVLIFHSPRLWLMDEHHPGTFQWDRASTLLLQLEQPLRTDIEPAMRARILVPLLGNVLGLKGYQIFIVPWVGVFCFLFYAMHVLGKVIKDQNILFGAALILASSSAILVPLHWYGMNDAWVWLALLVVGFSSKIWLVAIACLLGPWIDERFLIGLPLAWIVRKICGPDTRLFGRDLLGLAPLMVYPPLRLLLTQGSIETEQAFVSAHFTRTLTYIGLAPLAWWMGLKAAWGPIAYVLIRGKREWRILLWITFASTFFLTVFLAADLSRSAAIAVPLAVCGLVLIARDYPSMVGRIFVWLGVASVLLPTMHVVGRKLDPVENIFIELTRLFSQ